MRILREGEKGEGGKEKVDSLGKPFAGELRTRDSTEVCVLFSRKKNTTIFLRGEGGAERERGTIYNIFADPILYVICTWCLFFFDERMLCQKRVHTHTHIYNWMKKRERERERAIIHI
mmetsp:Transcript_25253/g.41038  ORF Transcript_25253/g.41038 Transcript_25253/m.41038 type:complete len:118 (+) Transcript_25253:54-407(+)